MWSLIIEVSSPIDKDHNGDSCVYKRSPCLILMNTLSISIAALIIIISILFAPIQIFDPFHSVFQPIFNSVDTLASLQLRVVETIRGSHLATQPYNVEAQYPIPDETMSVSRAIRKVFLAVEQAEGAGAKVRRSIGTPQLRNFSPFLMLDHFSVKPGAGFPDQ